MEDSPGQKDPITDRVPDPAAKDEFVVRPVRPDFLDAAISNQVAGLTVGRCNSRYPPRSDRSRPPRRQIDKRRIAGVATRLTLCHAQISNAPAVADQMDPLVPNVDAAIVRRIMRISTMGSRISLAASRGASPLTTRTSARTKSIGELLSIMRDAPPACGRWRRPQHSAARIPSATQCAR